jgi:hypothetical protein
VKIGKLAMPNLEVDVSFSSVVDHISNSTEETLHLEFKTLSDSSGEKITKEDRRVLARAICGMANAEGGTIIVGIETKRVENVDVAVASKLIKNSEKMRNLLVAAVPEMLSPQHPKVTVNEVSPDDDDAGFVVINVPSSEARPHYSNVHHQYFRRGSDGTRVLEHGEIRELMLAVTEGSLEIDWIIRSGMSTGDLRFSLSVVLNLRNTGRIPVIAPYVRISQGGGWQQTNLPNLHSRISAAGIAGIYAGRDVLVHVDDDIGITELSTGLDFRRTGQQRIEAALKIVRADGSAHFAMTPLDYANSSSNAVFDKPISISGVYGAENVASKHFNLQIGKFDLLEKFCIERGL